MSFSDLPLSRRLERAEGTASAQYAEARRRLFPDSGAEWIEVAGIGPEETQLWTDVSARGWAHEHPKLREFLLEVGAISAARDQSLCFVAELDGKPGAAGVLCVHQGVALFAGSATVPELRRHGLQTALLHGRMRYAFEHGCDLAMMVAQPGTESQHNAERNGFRIAYTRTKWHLPSPAL